MLSAVLSKQNAAILHILQCAQRKSNTVTALSQFRSSKTGAAASLSCRIEKQDIIQVAGGPSIADLVLLKVILDHSQAVSAKPVVVH